MDNKVSFYYVLKKEGFIIYPIKGISMLPILSEETDQVRIEISDTYNKYDVVLFISKDRRYVLHRIIDIKKDIYYIVGDNSYKLDKVKRNDILGKMVGFYHNDKYISIDDKEYKDYLDKYIINKDYRKRTLISPKDINKNYYVNDEIKKAYRSLFLYSVLPSKFNKEDITSLSKEDFYNFYLLCIYKKSDHILSEIVSKYNLDVDNKINARLVRIGNITKSRYLYLDYYKKEISNLFKDNNIKHIYFRGSELRERFINPILRASNDIDIYVDPSDLKKAEQLLIDKYHPIIYQTETVHHTYNLPIGHIQVEVHYALLESYLDNVNKIIGDPFIRSDKDKDNPYLYHMDDKYYYLYHLGHFAKHIKEGEYWISMLQDSYLLKDNAYNNPIIEEAGLNTFNDTINELISFYIGEGDVTDKVVDIEKILYKDAFNNYVLLNKNKYKNKFVYILRRIFLTPKELSTTFPYMKGRYYLYPYYFIKRLFFHKRKNKAIDELKTYNSLKKENLSSIYQNIGINF